MVKFELKRNKNGEAYLCEHHSETLKSVEFRIFPTKVHTYVNKVKQRKKFVDKLYAKKYIWYFKKKCNTEVAVHRQYNIYCYQSVTAL